MAQQNPTLPPQQTPALPPLLPPLQPPQRTYSPFQTQHSPGTVSPGGATQPPAKRPRLSPNPPSPYTSSPYVSSPYATSPTAQYLSLPGTPAPAPAPLPFNQPQPLYHQNDMASRAAPGSMGPPRLPADKTTNKQGDQLDKPERSTDINDLSDLVTAAGIDLREEEDYLAKNYRNQHQAASFSTSFNSQSSSTASPNNSFNAWSQGPGTYGAFQGTGPLSQPAVSEQTVRDELTEKHKQAARALSEAQQYHLTDPFLIGNNVRQKLHQRAYEHGIRMDVNGLFDKIAPTPQNVGGTVASGPDGTSIAAVHADSVLNRSAPMVEMLTLLSLATNERLRGVLEDAYALSRGRQVGSQGVVPTEWASLAVGNGNAQAATAIPTNLTKTAWEGPDSAVSPMTVPPLKQSESNAGRLPTPPTETPPTPQPTISFPNQLAGALRKIAARDRKFEEDRIAARAKRLRSSVSSIDSPTVPGTPIPGERMPEKMTKKERDRIARMGQSEEVLHRAANATASLALGGKKKYGWMSGTGGGSGASTPSRINTAVGSGVGSSSSGATGGMGAPDRALVARDRRFGEFKEDGPKGKGIQIRDLVHVLELDGKEKKTLVQALARLKSTET